MTEQTNSRRPVVAALYREALPPRLAEIEELAEVRLANVGRGELVHTGALTEALASGHALWSMDNAIITPNMSGDTENYVDDLSTLFIENLQRYCNAQPLQNIVDKTLGFVPAS